MIPVEFPAWRHTKDRAIFLCKHKTNCFSPINRHLLQPSYSCHSNPGNWGAELYQTRNGKRNKGKKHCCGNMAANGAFFSRVRVRGGGYGRGQITDRNLQWLPLLSGGCLAAVCLLGLFVSVFFWFVCCFVVRFIVYIVVYFVSLFVTLFVFLFCSLHCLFCCFFVSLFVTLFVLLFFGFAARYIVFFSFFSLFVILFVL